MLLLFVGVNIVVETVMAKMKKQFRLTKQLKANLWILPSVNIIMVVDVATGIQWIE